MAKEAFKRVSYKNRDILITLQFIIPSIAIMSIFILFPIIRAIIMAFQEWVLTMPSPTHPFIGLDNFREAFGLTHFPIMTVNTLVYTFCNVAGRMALGLGVALLLNQRFLGRSFVRGLMLIPWAMPTVVVTNVFRISLDPNYGLLNALVSKLPFVHGPIQFFASGPLALGTIICISIWKNFPFVSLMLLAALQSVAKDYYDAASIDGARGFIQFKKITWPLIKPIWNILAVLQILWTVKEFELIYLITQGGPNNGTNIIGIDIYLNAFRFYKVGVACAEGVLLLLFCLLFTSIYFKSIQKRENL
jgi:multiple sugar transport system permease protein